MGLIRSLLVKLGAETAGFEEGMKRARGGLYNLTSSIEKSAARMKLLGTATAIYLGITRISSFAARTFEAISSTERLAERVGISANEFRRLEFAANMSGIGLENVTQSITLMNKALGQQSDEGQKVRFAVARLGLDYEKLNKQSPQKTFTDILSALRKLPSQYEKTATAMAIFGRGGAMVLQMKEIPELLKRAAEINLDRTIFDSGLISEADSSFKEFKATLNALKQDIVIGLLPSLIDGAKHLQEFIGAGRRPEGENLIFTSKFGKKAVEFADTVTEIKNLILMPWTHKRGQSFWENVADALEPGLANKIAEYNRKLPEIVKLKEPEKWKKPDLPFIDTEDFDKFNRRLQDYENKLKEINPLIEQFFDLYRAGKNLAPEYQKSYNEQLGETARRLNQILNLEDKIKKEKETAAEKEKWRGRFLAPEEEWGNAIKELNRLRKEGIITYEQWLRGRLEYTEQMMGEKYVRMRKPEAMEIQPEFVSARGLAEMGQDILVEKQRKNLEDEEIVIRKWDEVANKIINSLSGVN